MKKTQRMLGALAIAGVSFVSGAAYADDNGLAVTASVAYAPVWGAIESGSAFNNNTNEAQIPLRLDIAYRFNSHFRVGVFGTWGPAPFTSCGQVNCSESNTRFGVAAELHLPLPLGFDPWLRGDVGYEYFTQQAINANGPSIGGAFGLDYWLTGNFSFGVSLDLTAGQYLARSTSSGSNAWHGLTGVALRATYAL